MRRSAVCALVSASKVARRCDFVASGPTYRHKNVAFLFADVPPAALPSVALESGHVSGGGGLLATNQRLASFSAKTLTVVDSTSPILIAAGVQVLDIASVSVRNSSSLFKVDYVGVSAALTDVAVSDCASGSFVFQNTAAGANATLSLSRIALARVNSLASQEAAFSSALDSTISAITIANCSLAGAFQLGAAPRVRVDDVSVTSSFLHTALIAVRQSACRRLTRVRLQNVAVVADNLVGLASGDAAFDVAIEHWSLTDVSAGPYVFYVPDKGNASGSVAFRNMTLLRVHARQYQSLFQFEWTAASAATSTVALEDVNVTDCASLTRCSDRTLLAPTLVFDASPSTTAAHSCSTEQKLSQLPTRRCEHERANLSSLIRWRQRGQTAAASAPPAARRRA